MHFSAQVWPAALYVFFHAFKSVLIRVLHPICDTDIAFASKLHLQLVLLGDSGVGKSCIVLRFVRGQFDPTSKV